MQYLALLNPQIVNPIRGFTAVQYINRIIPILILLAFVLCAVVFVIILIYGGIQYITSGGDKGKLEGARGRIINAITGLIVLLILWLILQLINTIFGINIGGLGVAPNQPIPTQPPGDRPAMCRFSTISGSTLPDGGHLNYTIVALDSVVVTGFQVSFYNADNGNQPIIFQDQNGDGQLDERDVYNQRYLASGTEHIFVITFDELNHPDLNWGSLIPVHILVKGFFFNDLGDMSAESVNCNETFTLASEGACVSGNFYCDCVCSPGSVPVTQCNQSQFPTCGGTCACQPYDQVYPPGLLLHYNLDEGTGTTAHDVSGYGFDGTLNGSAQWSGDANCGSGSINFPVANRSRIGLSGIYRRDFWSPSFTYSAWIKIDTGSIAFPRPIIDTNRAVDFRIDQYGTQIEATLGWDDNPGLGCATFPNHQSQMRYTLPSGSIGVWHHAALTYDYITKVARLYWDGLVVASATPIPEVDPWCTSYPLAFSVGQSVNYENQFVGNIDDARFYNYALTGSEITSVMNCGGAVPTVTPTPLPPCLAPTNLTMTSNCVGGLNNLSLDWDTSYATPVLSLMLIDNLPDWTAPLLISATTMNTNYSYNGAPADNYYARVRIENGGTTCFAPSPWSNIAYAGNSCAPGVTATPIPTLPPGACGPGLVENRASDSSCDQVCNNLGQTCQSVGTNPAGDNDTKWTRFSFCQPGPSSCGDPMTPHTEPCAVGDVDWTCCNCN